MSKAYVIIDDEKIEVNIAAARTIKNKSASIEEKTDAFIKIIEKVIKTEEDIAEEFLEDVEYDIIIED